MMSDETQGPGGTLSRRLLLQGTASAMAAAAAVTVRPEAASAVVKISKEAVAYQDHPQGDKRCGKCAQFQPPQSCKLVDGPISTQGFCRIFSPVKSAAGPMTRAVFSG